MIFINEKTIKADEGMKLTNGEAFANIVYLGNNDCAENWKEITIDEAKRLKKEQSEEPDYKTLLDIITGGDGE